MDPGDKLLDTLTPCDQLLVQDHECGGGAQTHRTALCEAHSHYH